MGKHLGITILVSYTQAQVSLRQLWEHLNGKQVSTLTTSYKKMSDTVCVASR